MKTLDGSKLYIGLLAVVMLLVVFYFFKATTSKSISQGLIEQQEQAFQDQSNLVSETALKWTVKFFTTDQGPEAWLNALSSITAEKYLNELKGVVAGLIKPNDELISQTLSYLEAAQEQNVKISLSGIYQDETDWRVSMLAQAYYIDVSADISVEVVISTEGDELKVKAAYFQQLSD
jgi:hypothetical protein